MNPYGYFDLPWYTLAGVLLLFHLLYDYHLQGSYISSGKATSRWLLTVHAVTWTLWVSVPLYLVGTLSGEQLLFLLLTHWAMDWYKSRKMQPVMGAQVVDQTVHLATLALVMFAW